MCMREDLLVMSQGKSLGYYLERGSVSYDFERGSVGYESGKIYWL